jgi:hypothetical protein
MTGNESITLTNSKPKPIKIEPPEIEPTDPKKTKDAKKEGDANAP